MLFPWLLADGSNRSNTHIYYLLEISSRTSTMKLASYQHTVLVGVLCLSLNSVAPVFAHKEAQHGHRLQKGGSSSSGDGSSSDDGSNAIEFVNDLAFPAGSDGRETLPVFEFSIGGSGRSSTVVTVTAVDQNGVAANIARRGPGGLGIEGNTDRDANGDGGTTSGNRVNAGESLILTVTDRHGEAKTVNLESVTFSRIVRDLENFPDAPVTAYKVTVGDGAASVAGILNDALDEVTVGFGDSGLVLSGDTFSISNGLPFDAIANRFRVSAITFN